MNVAVLGASPKPDRYANKAVRSLLQHGHDVIPLNPAYAEIEGLACRDGLADLAPEEADTITVYMNPDRTRDLASDFIRARPRRVIFNPGAENADLARVLEKTGIEAIEACTLVLLNTNQF